MLKNPASVAMQLIFWNILENIMVFFEIQEPSLILETFGTKKYLLVRSMSFSELRPWK